MDLEIPGNDFILFQFQVYSDFQVYFSTRVIWSFTIFWYGKYFQNLISF